MIIPKKFIRISLALALAFLLGILVYFFAPFGNKGQSDVTNTSSESNISTNPNLLFGMFYFPGWSNTGYHWNVYKSIKNDFPERTKVDGWEDMTTPESMDKEITWAKNGGIDYFIFDWYWDKTTKAPLNIPGSNLSYAIPSFKKVNAGRMKYTLLWCPHGQEALSEADSDILIDYWEKNYFNDPDFLLTPGGQPFFAHWSQEDLIQSFGKDSSGTFDRARGTANLQKFMQKLKNKFNIFNAVVADSTTIANADTIKSLGFDSILGWGYLNARSYSGAQVSQYEVFKDYAAKVMSAMYKLLPLLKIDVIPSLLPGRN